MMLIADGLTSIRGGRRLFAGLSFTIAPGEGLLLTGPNGSGKTTLLRTLAGLLSPAEGRVRLEGVPDAERGITEHCHYMGHLDAIKGSLSVAANALFWCRFLGGGSARVGSALEAFGLGALDDLPARYLSAGQKRRLALARLLLAERPLWLLDEPTVALDAGAQAALVGIIDGHLARGGMVIAATHAPLALAASPRHLRLGEASGSA